MKGSTNTMSKSLLSLKALANEIADKEINNVEPSLSKNVENINDKQQKLVDAETVKNISDIDLLIDNVTKMKDILPVAGSTVTVRISKQGHKLLSELKLCDGFENCRYGDLLEALLMSFIQKNRTEIKKRLSHRKSLI